MKPDVCQTPATGTLTENGVPYNRQVVTAVDGFEFEVRVSVLLALRCLQRGWPFHVATNATDFHPFDDVVIAYHDGSGPKVWALQLKHSCTAAAIGKRQLTVKGKKKKDVSLSYYFTELSQNKEEKEEKRRAFLRNLGIDYNEVVIQHGVYTNIPVKLDGLGSQNRSPACFFASRDNTLKFSSSDDIIDALKNDQPELQMEICDFLDTFTLFYEQDNLMTMDSLLKRELKEHFLVTEAKVDKVLNVLISCVKWWWRNEAEGTLTESHHLFQEFFRTISRVFSLRIHPKVAMKEECLHKYREMLQKKFRCFRVQSNAGEWPLQIQMLEQALSKTLVVTPGALQENWSAIKAVLSSLWYNTLVIRANGDAWPEKSVADFLKQHVGIRMILVGSYKGQQFEFLDIDVTISYENLTTDMQNKVMSHQVYFQGYPMNIEELSESESLKHYLNAGALWEVLQGNPESVGCSLETLSDIYVSRRCTYEKGQIHEESLLRLGHTALIVGNPGMGKTELFKSMAIRTKKAAPNLWVIPINFRNFTDILGTDNPSAEILLKAACGKSVGKFERNLFELYKKFGQFAIFVDAFDEINPQYTNKCLSICQVLQKHVSDRGYFWVATRPICRAQLSRVLNVNEFLLSPLSSKDLPEFFDRYLISLYPSSNNHTEILKDCLNFLQAQENVYIRDLIAVPLQAKVLMQCLTENDIGNLEFPKNIAITTLYKIFIDKTIGRLMEEKQSLNFQDPPHISLAETAHLKYIKDHQILALYHIFPTNILKELGAGILLDAQTLLKDFERINQLAGIVTLLENNRLTFIHQTFAEYLAATWLQKHARSEFVKNYYSEEYLFQTWTFFDLLFVGDRNLHTSALLGNSSNLSDQIRLREEKNLQDALGRTPLHLAVIGAARMFSWDWLEGGETHIVQGLLDAGCNSNIRDLLLNWTALQYADYFKAYATVDVLLQHGGDCKELREILEDTNPLHKAAALNLLETMKVLLDSGHPVDDRTEDGETPLHWACRSGREEAVRLLLDSGADVSAADDRRRTALHWAAVEGREGSIRLLLEAAERGRRLEVIVNAEDEDGNTALDCSNESASNALLLQHGSTLKYGLDEATKFLSVSKKSPLAQFDTNDDRVTDGSDLTEKQVQLECIQSSEEADQFLEDKGACIVGVVSDHHTVVHWAKKEGTSKCIKLLLEAAQRKGRQDIVHAIKNLMRTSFDFSRQKSCQALLMQHGGKGKFALHGAVALGEVHTVATLLDEGIPVDSRNPDSETALHVASRSGKKEVVRLLLERGADIAAVDMRNYTPLHWTAKNGHDGCSKLLLEAAEREGHLLEIVNAKNKWGNTPLDCTFHQDSSALLLRHGGMGKLALHKAVELGDQSVVAALLKAGAPVDARNAERETPLHVACRLGRAEALRLLLDHGADVAALEKRRRSALHTASASGRWQCLRILLEAVQRQGRFHVVNAKDMKGMTPFDCSNDDECCALLCHYGGVGQDSLQQEGTMVVLPKSGVSAKQRNEFQGSIVHSAASIHMEDRRSITPDLYSQNKRAHRF